MKLVLGSDFPNIPPKGELCTHSLLTEIVWGPPITCISLTSPGSPNDRRITEDLSIRPRRGLKMQPDFHAGYFLTKIFHPNVSKPGEICVNVLKRDWKPDMGLRHVLVIVRCLLIEPFPGVITSLHLPLPRKSSPVRHPVSSRRLLQLK